MLFLTSKKIWMFEMAPHTFWYDTLTSSQLFPIFWFLISILGVADYQKNELSLADCLTMLRNLAKGSRKKYKQKTWFHRIRWNHNNNWTKNKPFLFKVLLKMQYLNGSCCVCAEQKAITAWGDCCHSPIYQRCDHDTHSMHPLHDRKSYENGYVTSLSPAKLLSTNPEIELFGKLFLNF